MTINRASISLRPYLCTSFLLALLATEIFVKPAIAGTDAFGQPKSVDIPFEKLLLNQIKAMSLQAEQLEPFRDIMRQFFRTRNGSTRRISTQGGDLAFKVRRDLRRCGRNSVSQMAAVLTDEQLMHYEEFVAIAIEQYLVSTNLRN